MAKSARTRRTGTGGRAKSSRTATATRRFARGKRPAARVTLYVGTLKGAWVLRGDPTRRAWKVEGPHFLGCVVNHVVRDPRDRRTLLMGVRTGHLGPTVMRSEDAGRTWKEAKSPPRFSKVPEGETGRAVKAVFWLTPGHAERPGEWWAGTVPHGIFRTRDGGVTWEECVGFTKAWEGWNAVPGRIDDVPGGAITHSVIVHPRDPRHLYVGLSTGGFFESLDEGATWTALNRGVSADFLPEKDPEFGHDPHCVAIHPDAPDRLWQQNHCGVYLLERPAITWTRIGKNLPRAIGDVGFPMVVHPHDPRSAFVVPMDGTSTWPRTSVGGKPAVYRTSNLGATWKRLDRGLPRRDAHLTVKRQAFCADAATPAGLYLGTTSGEIYASRDEGASWRRILEHLPHVVSVTSTTDGR